VLHLRRPGDSAGCRPAREFEHHYGRAPSQRELTHLAQAFNVKTRNPKHGALDVEQADARWPDKLTRTLGVTQASVVPSACHAATGRTAAHTPGAEPAILGARARFCPAASLELLPGCYAPLGCQLLHPGGGSGPLGWWCCHHDEPGHADPGELGEDAGAAIGQRHGHAQLAQVTAARPARPVPRPARRPLSRGG
jgi:hypothetical protein